MCLTIIATFHLQKCINTLYMACRHSSVLLNLMQSLGLTELWIIGNTKRKINATGKIAKNVVYFPRLKLV